MTEPLFEMPPSEESAAESVVEAIAADAALTAEQVQEAVAAGAVDAEQLPEKFRDPEAFAKSYRSLEAKLSEQGRELGRLREQLSEQAALADQFRSEVASDPELSAFSNALEFEDWRAMQQIELAARQSVREQAIQAVPGLAEALTAQTREIEQHVAQVEGLLDQHVPDWREYGPHIQEAVARNPQLFAEPDARVVAQRYAGVVQRAKAEAAQIANGGPLVTAEQVAAHEEMKRLAQTASGAGTRPMSPDEAQAEWDRIKAAGMGSYSDRMHSGR